MNNPLASLWLKVDHDADAAYLHFLERVIPGSAVDTHPVEFSQENGMVNGMVNVDLDANGCILGIEFLGAETLLSPELRTFTHLRPAGSPPLCIEWDRVTDIAHIDLGSADERELRFVVVDSLPSGSIEFGYATTGRIVSIVVRAASRVLPDSLCRSLGA